MAKTIFLIAVAIIALAGLLMYVLNKAPKAGLAIALISVAVFLIFGGVTLHSKLAERTTASDDGGIVVASQATSMAETSGSLNIVYPFG